MSLANEILVAFTVYRAAFDELTANARGWFEASDWESIQEAMVERRALYLEFTQQMQARLEAVASVDWSALRREYAQLIAGRADSELACTAFNTLYRKSNSRATLDDDHAFVTEIVLPDASDADLLASFGPSSDLPALLGQVLDHYAFAAPFQDQAADVRAMVTTMQRSIPLLRHESTISIDLLKVVLFRNKGAYLIGQMLIDDHWFPLAIPIQHETGQGLYVDTVIWNEDDLSMIFSFTRSYFLADSGAPAATVDFLAQLLPNKQRSELYTSLGHYKHGKTEFYKGLINHLRDDEDRFVLAEGIPGLVMVVFALSSYQVVFKVIKDRFPHSKKVTRDGVKAAYQLVKTHDRVGRMADTQEFHELHLPLAQFDDEVVESLQRQASQSIEIRGDEVVLSHVYAERQMTPLNLYINHCSSFELDQVMEDYGRAIKQLAAANIFPGDMLPKNFGVTRHRRVVFYDYDEICYLTDVNFRELPGNYADGQGMANEPWYDVGEQDVFPQEFEHFLLGTRELRELFKSKHGDLFTPLYWQIVQEQIRNHQIVDVFPYRISRRFRHG